MIVKNYKSSNIHDNKIKSAISPSILFIIIIFQLIGFSFCHQAKDTNSASGINNLRQQYRSRPNEKSYNTNLGSNTIHNQNKNSKDIDKLKRDALIDGFKAKLLKLLEVDEVPSPSKININTNPIPEPILREYNRLVKMSNNEKLRRRGGISAGGESRNSRHMSSENSNEIKDYELESVRFNGSYVEQVTLLPKNCKINSIKIFRKIN
jgi:hypothetical protein